MRRTQAHVSDPAGITAEELAGLRFFEGVPGWALERLARSATKRRFEQGAIVVRQNDEARAVYFLLSGAVQILVYFEGSGRPLDGRAAGSGKPHCGVVGVQASLPAHVFDEVRRDQRAGPAPARDLRENLRR
jgi:hypothetical protein